MTNSLMSCIKYLCTFGSFITKSFYYLNLIWCCDLLVMGNSPCFCPLIWE